MAMLNDESQCFKNGIMYILEFTLSEFVGPKLYKIVDVRKEALEYFKNLNNLYIGFYNTADPETNLTIVVFTIFWLFENTSIEELNSKRDNIKNYLSELLSSRVSKIQYIGISKGEIFNNL